MKKYKSILFILLIIILITICIILYKNISKKDEKNNEEKATAEIEFLENKLVNLLNKMNNIEIRNYSVAVTKINKKENEEETNSSSQETSASKDSKEQESNNSSNQSLDDKESTQVEEFKLESTSILLREDEIDWEEIKKQVENLYSSVPTITLDLYQIQVTQDDILNFNKNLDTLTKAVQNENKEQALSNLSLLYEYIPKFAAKVEKEDELYNVIFETKSNLFKAYSKLDSKNWNDISIYTKQTIESFTKILTSEKVDASKQYTIKKIYIMINELQNAVNMQDEKVFLIKYKNILEEMNDL